MDDDRQARFAQSIGCVQFWGVILRSWSHWWVQYYIIIICDSLSPNKDSAVDKKLCYVIVIWAFSDNCYLNMGICDYAGELSYWCYYSRENIKISSAVCRKPPFLFCVKYWSRSMPSVIWLWRINWDFEELTSCPEDWVVNCQGLFECISIGHLPGSLIIILQNSKFRG